MKRILLPVLLVAAICLPVFGRAALNPNSPFEVIWDEAPVKVVAGKKFKVAVTIRVPPDHYIYADRTDVDFASLEGVRIDEIKYPRAEKMLDPYFGKTMDVFKNDVVIEIVGHIPEDLRTGEHELNALLSFQGCSSKLCLRPEELDLAFIVNVEAAKEEPSKRTEGGKEEGGAVSGEGLSSLIRSQDFTPIAERGFAWAMLVVFLAGLLVSLSPCILPIVPVVLLTIGVEAQKKWSENISLAATFVAGLVVTNAGLGLLAAAFGRTIGFLFQYRLFLVAVIVFFVLMALSMFGLYEFRPIGFVHRWLHKIGGKGYRGALLMGLATGLIASPCASPVLVALLGYVGLKQSYALGSLMLVIFGLGMGLLFIIFGAAYGELAGKFKSGKWAVWVKRALGILLLIPAVFYLRALVRWDGVFHPGVDEGKPRVEWVMTKDDGLKFARRSGRPVMVEFYADWCPPCRTLENRFFKDEEVIKLSSMLVPVKIDATVSTPEVNRMIEEFKVIGWPAFFFMSPDGRIYDDLTVMSYAPEKLLESMREAVKRAGGRP